MKIICAPDSFKESMAAMAAAQAMAKGIHRVDANAECVLCPVADGGEGTTETLVSALGGDLVEVPCHDALGRPATARFGWIPEQKLAVIEMAQGSGLEQIAPEDRDARITTTAGVGELLSAALDKGAERIIMGLGGSATNDAGTGMLQALGCRFLDASGADVQPGGAQLADLASVDASGLDPRLADCEIRLASDVTNPLLGDNGASAVFGPQKGATPEHVAELDLALTRWADVVEAATGRVVRDQPGAGAAGGLGAAFLAFTDASMQRGVDLVIETVGLTGHLAQADYVFTGEGRIDAQTSSGKAPWGVAQAARAAGVPTVLFGGLILPEADDLIGDNVLRVVQITPEGQPLTEALARGGANLAAAAGEVYAELARA